MRRWWLVGALLLSLGVNLGLGGAILLRRSQPERSFVPPPGAEPGGRLADWLRLDGDERRAFIDAQRRLSEQVVAERREIARLRLELRRELLSEAPDPARLDGLLSELAAHESAVNRAFVDSVVASRATLSGRTLERYLRFVERFAAPRGPGEEGRGRLERRPRGGERRPPR